jgi:hypothetical protein
MQASEQKIVKNAARLVIIHPCGTSAAGRVKSISLPTRYFLFKEANEQITEGK